MTSHDEVKGEGFEIIDHQQPEGRPDDAPRESAPGAQEHPAHPTGGPSTGSGSPPSTAEGLPRAKPTGGGLVSVDVYAILRISIAQLACIAWQMMGLQPDPFTNQLRKDLLQAKVAIDAAAALVDLLKPHVHGQEARDHQALLTDLRLNFVSHSGPEAAPTD